jgi:RNA polymerase sigma-70 factor (ECF subfamily)
MSPTAQDALGQVFLDHERDVQRLCRRMLGDAAAAQDAAGETFVRAQQSLAGYDESRPMRPWLLGIAANLCIDLIRRRGTEAHIFDDAGADPEALADRALSPLGHLLHAEERAALLSGIDALPVKYRLPLVLRHFAELDYDAIAELLGTSRNQVGSLLFRARQRLRIALGGTSA